MFSLKADVNPNASKEIWYAIGVADAVYWTMFRRRLVVTSVFGGPHAQNSLHFKDPSDAADVRDRDLSDEESKRFYIALKQVLPAGYDLVLESPATTGKARHVHIEWQPKEGERPFLVYEQGGSNELAQH